MDGKKSISMEDKDSFRAVFQSSSDLMLILDDRGIILDSNLSASRILGYPKDELTERGLASISADESRLKLLDTLNSLSEENPFQEIQDAVFFHKDGHKVQLDISTTSIAGARNTKKLLITGTASKYKNITDEGVKQLVSNLESKLDEKSRELNTVIKDLEEAKHKSTIWAEHLERRSNGLAVLAEMGDLLQSCETVEEAGAIIGKIGTELFGELPGGLYIFKKTRSLLEIVTSWGDASCLQPMFEPNDCWALRRGKLHITRNDDGSRVMICRHVTQSEGNPASETYMCIPMLAQGEVLGIFHLRSPCTDGKTESSLIQILDKEHEQLARTMADHIALALANLNLRETLKHQSTHDKLTGIFNRQYLDVTLKRELLRAVRDEIPVGVIMADIDHFKQFNDSFGHDAGDLLLKAVAKYLQSKVRSHDIVCRYGGEEFLVVLPGTDIKTVTKRADQIREGVKGIEIMFDKKVLGPVCLSLGVAVYPVHGVAAEELIASADNALFIAKRGGRDRVCVAVSPHKKAERKV